MPWEAWVTLATIALVVVAMVKNLAGADTAMLAALTLLMTVGHLFQGNLPTPLDAAAGFGNESLVTIGALFVVAAGLARTGGMNLLTQRLLGRPRSTRSAIARLMLPVAGLSGFLNNTPIVAMFVPVVNEWCRRSRLSPSKLFIPLSYAAIMGGSCTLIGTSSNLLVNAMVIEATTAGELSGVQLGMFTISAVGVPATVVGVVYMLVVAPWLLPDRRAAAEDTGDGRRYIVEMLVQPDSAVDGQSIGAAGLRHLPGVYLAEIERDGERLVAVGPEQRLRGADRLIFVGLVESVVDLQRIRGLVPATDQVFKLSDPRPDRCLVEAVVSNSCPLVGRSIRAGRFRTVFDAVVIAVHRGGEHLKRRIGDIVLRPGDTLLIETHPRFVEQQRNRRDFYLVSPVAGSQPIRHDRAGVALAIMIAMVGLVTLGILSLLNAALLAGGLMVACRCLSPLDARRSIDMRVLLAMGAALGVGRALEQSGAARLLADVMFQAVTASGLGLRGLLGCVYLTAMLFNMVTGNIASAVLVFPVARMAALSGDQPFMPFVLTIMMAASSSYATPISYPTNLMVYGAGGYRFTDYLRVGLPLNLLIMTVTILLAPLVTASL